ncbi:MAG: hypothetical protein AAGB93_02510 [Planctomycetota bacterium]
MNCRKMEVFIFPRPSVRELKRGFVEARLHSDATDPALRARIAELIETVAKSPAQPIYVSLDPDSEVEYGRFNGATLSDPEPFAEFLRDMAKAGSRASAVGRSLDGDVTGTSR